uniref:Anamorsin N-terminal domain-containing protein n=1 Tax=Cucumis sativus TaxID=3659 RepID=A0A0A0LEP8_CUCSA
MKHKRNLIELTQLVNYKCNLCRSLLSDRTTPATAAHPLRSEDAGDCNSDQSSLRLSSVLVTFLGLKDTTMKSVLTITDDTVLATSIVVNVLQDLGNEYVGNCDSQIITQAFSLNKLPLGASSMDVIISICRSDFPSDQLCEEILRVLQPDGIILIHKTPQSVAFEKDEPTVMVRRLLLAGFLEAQVIEKKLVSSSDVESFVVRFRYHLV